MTQKIEAHTRMEIVKFLPHALGKALDSYKLFRNKKHHEEPKEFKAHHEACKAAIAHVQLLIKLAEWAHLPDKSESMEIDQTELAGMIEKARAEIGEKEIPK